MHSEIFFYSCTHLQQSYTDEFFFSLRLYVWNLVLPIYNSLWTYLPSSKTCKMYNLLTIEPQAFIRLLPIVIGTQSIKYRLLCWFFSLFRQVSFPIYSLHTWKESRFRQRHGLQGLTLTSYFYKNIYRKVIYLYFYESIFQDKSIHMVFLYFETQQLKSYS